MPFMKARKHEKRIARLGLRGAVTTVLALAATASAVPPLPVELQIKARRVGVLQGPTGDAMHMPTDVAVDSRGRVWVADGANDRIMRFTTQGRPDRIISTVGDERFHQPVGLTVDSKDRLWVADTGEHRLLVLTSEAALVERIPLTMPDGRVADPTDLLVAPDGSRTWVIDNDNHRVLVRDNTTGSLTARGRFGSGLSQFQWPFMIAATRDGDILITEAIGARVQRISRTGRWAGQISRWGVEAGQLYRPKGIAVDERNRVFVSDSTLGVVQVFKATGELIGVLCEETGRIMRFEHPMGMCFDKQSRLYVVELRAHRVALITLLENASPATGGPAGQTQPHGEGS